MDFRIKAASFVLSNDDVEKALNLLDETEGTIPEEVIVWEKFENDSIEEVIEIIDELEAMLIEAWEEGKRDNQNK